MREGRGLTSFIAVLAAALLVPLLVGLLGARREAADLDSLLSSQRAELDNLRSGIRALELRADSLSALARTRADTVQVAVERWRTLTDTLRLRDTVWVRELAAAGDTLAAACMQLGRECSRALAAKDSVLEAERLQADLLARYNAELAGRLRGESRKKWLYGLGGVGVTLAFCRAAR